MILARSMTRPRAMEERTLSWDEVQSWVRQVFFSGEELESSQVNAERLSPVAAAHRILTNSFGLIPFGLYRKDGEERVPVEDTAMNRVLKVRANDYMSPFMMRKLTMSNAFWHGFGAVWNRKGPDGRVVQRLPLPSDCCSIRKDLETGQYWYDYNVDGIQRTFTNYELSFLYFETYDGIRGRGLLDLARETIALDAMAQRYGKKFYQNGARLSGVLEVDTDAKPETRQKLKLNYVTDTLLPYVVQWESEDSYKLPTPQERDSGVYIRGNVEVLLRADPTTRSNFYEKMIQNSVYNPDECRAKEEKNPIPGGLGKHFFMTKNLGSLESVLKGDAADG